MMDHQRIFRFLREKAVEEGKKCSGLEELKGLIEGICEGVGGKLRNLRCMSSRSLNIP